MKSTSILLFFILLISACNLSTSDRSKSFKRFTKRFKTVDLPISTEMLYRVHNSDLVSARIDTSLVQQFINSDYKLEVDAPVYDGYAYAIKFPKEKVLNYQGLIYYKSEGQSQFFTLNTYSLKGELIATLPLSGDSSSYKRQTCQISEDRLIITRSYLLHQEKAAEENAIEYFYEINENGLIHLLDSL